MDFVMVAKVAMVAIFPNVASVGIEKRMVTGAIRELDTGKSARCLGGLRLENRLQGERGKKQGDQREDRFCVKVNSHVGTSNLSPQFAGWVSTGTLKTENIQPLLMLSIPMI
jgi:hypothetical protein